MVWGDFAFLGADIAGEKAKFAAELRRKSAENNMNMQANMYGIGTSRPLLLTPRNGNTQAGNYPAECPSCHSHEFRMHHGRWLCSFCRSSA